MCLTKKIQNTNAENVNTTVGQIFSKYVHCDVRFSVVKIYSLLCFLNGFGIAVLVFVY